MSKKILIIRSVSFQQLDKNMEAIDRMFPSSKGEWEYHLLTHSHGIPRARSYKALAKCIDYDSSRNFTFFHIPDCFKKERENLKNKKKHKIKYKGIFVPVTNNSGTGFLNVLMMCLRIPANDIYVCNLNSKIWRIPKKRIIFQAFKSFLLSIISLLLIFPLIFLFFAFLIRFLLRRRKKKGTP